MTFAVGEESPYYTYGYILAKANTNEGKVVFQGPWMEPYKKVQQFSSNTILDAQFHHYPDNIGDFQQQYPAGGQFANAGFQKYPTEADIVEVEWNTEDAASVWVESDQVFCASIVHQWNLSNYSGLTETKVFGEGTFSY